MSQGAALMSLSLRTLKDRLHTDVFVFINAELLPHICLDAGVISALLFVQYFFRREYFYCFTSCKWCVSYQWKHIGHLLFPVLNDILVVFFRKGAFWYTYMTDNFSYCPLWFTLLFFFVFDNRRLRRSSTTISSCLSWRSRDTTGSSVQSHEPGRCRRWIVNTWTAVQFSTRQKSM